MRFSWYIYFHNYCNHNNRNNNRYSFIVIIIIIQTIITESSWNVFMISPHFCPYLDSFIDTHFHNEDMQLKFIICSENPIYTYCLLFSGFVNNSSQWFFIWIVFNSINVTFFRKIITGSLNGIIIILVVIIKQVSCVVRYGNDKP